MTYDGKKDREELGAKPLPVHRLLGQNRLHVIPLFQRPYVWTREKQWEPFWADVQEVAESILDKRPKAHFFGAVVFKLDVFPTGAIEIREVIDGQQRLCTLLVLVKAVRDAALERGLKELADELGELLFNSVERFPNETDRFKVLPNNVDREPFLTIMNAAGDQEVASLLAAGVQGKQLFEAYRFFSEGVREWIDRDGTGKVATRAFALRTAIKDRVRIVVIDLEAEDDPQTIFESLNARNTPLLDSDLVKNHLFHRARFDGSDLERLYKENWKVLDEDPSYWRGEVGRGHAKRPRIDLFLQHFTTAKLKEEVAVERLYRRFKAWSEREASGVAEQQLREFRKWAEKYRSLDERKGDEEEGQFFERLRVIDIETIFPVLLYLYQTQGIAAETLAGIRRDLESFLVRRMVGGLSTRGYGKLFLSLLGRLDEKHGDAATIVREFLLEQTAEGNRWPDDKEFRRLWLERPVGDILRRDRIGMILKALERSGRPKKAEAVSLQEKLTIEHVLPEDWSRRWPLPAGKNDDAGRLRRDTLVQTMGNLTIVTGKLNSGMGNNAWEKKRSALDEYSVLWLNGEIIKHDDWNEEVIEERGNALCTMACQIWPRPGDAAERQRLLDDEDTNGSHDTADEDENGTDDEAA